MDKLGNLLQKSNFTVTEPKYKPMTEDERIQKEIEIYNDSDGELTADGINCPICKNKGYIMKRNSEGYKVVYPCKCMIGRRSRTLIRKSGLGKLLSMYTMDTYKCTMTWQSNIKALALKYADHEFKDHWFYIGGAVGSGKTHICTAIVSLLIELGIEVKYMLWRDDIAKIKASTYGDGYSDTIQKWKEVPALYIDDFFKSDVKPTAADINLAFEILNYRYNNNLPTLISSEYDIDIILSIDEAIGSRIFQMCGDFCLTVSKGPAKNIRMEKGDKNGNR